MAADVRCAWLALLGPVCLGVGWVCGAWDQREAVRAQRVAGTLCPYTPTLTDLALHQWAHPLPVPASGAAQ